MDHEGFLTLFSGLLAVVMLATSICLTQAREDGAYRSVMRMLSAAGLAATVLFALGIVYHLAIQIVLALNDW